MMKNKMEEEKKIYKNNVRDDILLFCGKKNVQSLKVLQSHCDS